MWATVRQNLILFLLVALTLNVIAITVITITPRIASLISSFSAGAQYDIIDCKDGSAQVHKCIRVDPKAGEVTNPATGASYRVIWGR